MNNPTSLISSLWNYIKKPDYNIKPIEASFKEKLGDIIKYWSLGIVVAFFAGIGSAFLLSQTGVDDSQNILQDFFVDNSVIFIVFLVFFWGPITEEITFRLVLRYSPYRLGISLGFVSFLFFELLLVGSTYLSGLLEDFINKIGTLFFLFLSVLAMLSIGLFTGSLISKINISKKIENFYQKNFSWLFYGSTIIFAGVHVFNFENFKDIWLALPFLVAPQLFLGFILAFIRMRYSIGWSVFYHIFHNSIISLPLLLLSQVSEESLEIITKSTGSEPFDIPVTEKAYIMIGSGFSIFILLLVLVSFYYLIKNHKKYKTKRE